MISQKQKAEIDGLADSILALVAGKIGNVALESITQAQAKVLTQIFDFETANRLYTNIAEMVMEEAAQWMPEGPVHEAPQSREDYALAGLRFPKAKSAGAGQ